MWQYLESMPLSEHVRKAGENARGALEQEVVSAWQPLESNGEVHDEQRVLTATARRP